jgi:hypothetical protein
MELGGLSPTRRLRKALSHKRPVRPLRSYQAEFYGALARRVARRIDKVWTMISPSRLPSASPTARHAPSFRAEARAHYPAEFIAAVISNQATTRRLPTCRRQSGWGRPDVNESEREYRGGA